MPFFVTLVKALLLFSVPFFFYAATRSYDGARVFLWFFVIMLLCIVVEIFNL